MRALMGRLVVVAVSVAVAALAGCSVAVTGVAAPAPSALAAPTADPVPAGDRFSDAKNRFTLAPPKGWKVDSSGVRGTAVVFEAPTPVKVDGGNFGANINVLVVASPADLASTIAAARQQLRGTPGYASTTDEDAVLYRGTPAHLLGGTFTYQATGLPLRNLQIFTVHGGTTTVVTGTAPAADWTTYGAAFDAALRTLTVES